MLSYKFLEQNVDDVNENLYSEGKQDKINRLKYDEDED